MKTIIFLSTYFLLFVNLIGISQSDPIAIDDNYNSQRIRIPVSGLEREFIISIPTSCTDSLEKCPVVFMLHGGGGTGKKYYKISGWKELGHTEGFATVYPSGLSFCIEKDGVRKEQTYWTNQRKIDQACNKETLHDDVFYLDSILSYLEKEGQYDMSRIFAVGFSNGLGFIQDRLMPERSNMFAGFAGAGNFLDSIKIPDHPVKPYLTLAGQRDPILMKQNNDLPLPIKLDALTQNEMLKDIIKNYLSTLGLAKSFYSKEQINGLSLHFDKNKIETASIFRLNIMKDVAHNWPSQNNAETQFNAPEIIWNFFQKYCL